MGAWAYCKTCDTGLEKPTAKELYHQTQYCNNGHFNHPTGDLGYELGDMTDRLNKLEADNKRLKRQMARVLGALNIQSTIQVVSK